MYIVNSIFLKFDAIKIKKLAEMVNWYDLSDDDVAKINSGIGFDMVESLDDGFLFDKNDIAYEFKDMFEECYDEEQWKEIEKWTKEQKLNRILEVGSLFDLDNGNTLFIWKK